MYVLTTFFVFISLISAIGYYSTKDKIWCSISNTSNYNGYYTSKDGIYFLFEPTFSYLPSFSELWSTKSTEAINYSSTQINFQDGSWLLSSAKSKLNYYVTISPFLFNYLETKKIETSPELLKAQEDYIKNPSDLVWYLEGQVKQENGQNNISKCQGGLFNSSPTKFSKSTENLSMFLSQMSSSTILLIITCVFLYIKSNSINPANVAIIYSNISDEREYWRLLTGTLSHFELFHYAFNTMGLIQFGTVEALYGSFKFFELSAVIFFLNSLLFMLLYSLMINYFNKPDYKTHQTVGYSGILFAWMVVYSMKNEEFCPIFFYPDFCLKTFFLDIPGTSISLAINAGPFVLLGITQLIFSRSSFIGHLSGIFIGYFIGWNTLDWISLSRVIGFMFISVAWHSRLYVWKMRDFSSTWEVFYETIGPNNGRVGVETANASNEKKKKVNRVKIWKGLIYFYLICSLAIGFFLFNPLDFFIIRLVGFYLLWSAMEARRLISMQEDREIQRESGEIILYAFFYLIFIFCNDFLSYILIFFNGNLLLHSGISSEYYKLSFLLIPFIILEAVLLYTTLVWILQSLEALEPLLKPYYLHKANTEKEVKRILDFLPKQYFTTNPYHLSDPSTDSSISAEDGEDIETNSNPLHYSNDTSDLIQPSNKYGSNFAQKPQISQNPSQTQTQTSKPQESKSRSINPNADRLKFLEKFEERQARSSK